MKALEMEALENKCKNLEKELEASRESEHRLELLNERLTRDLNGLYSSNWDKDNMIINLQKQVEVLKRQQELDRLTEKELFEKTCDEYFKEEEQEQQNERKKEDILATKKWFEIKCKEYLEDLKREQDQEQKQEHEVLT